MKKPGDVADELWVSTRTAHPREVKKFAEDVSSDPDFVSAVIEEYSKLQTRACEFDATLRRTMPD